MRPNSLRVLAPCALVLAWSAGVSAAAKIEGLHVQTLVFPAQYGGIIQTPYLLLPDGHAAKSWATGGGLDGFDFAAAQKQYPKLCGSYAVEGAKITFTFPGSKPEEYELREDGGKAHISNWARAGQFRAGHRLKGVYSARSSVGGAGLFAGKGQTLRFADDGSFRLETSTGVSAGAGAQTSKESTAGTYLLSGNTLKLTHGGKTETYTLFVFTDKDVVAAPSILKIDASTFSLQE